jgi:hypothetical protein
MNYLFYREIAHHLPPRSDLNPNDGDVEAVASTKAFFGALAVNGMIAAASITAFTYMRPYFRIIYEPRSLSVFEGCAFPRHFTVEDTNCCLENDSLHYALGSGDGRNLSFLRTIARLRISMGWTAIVSSACCA